MKSGLALCGGGGRINTHSPFNPSHTHPSLLAYAIPIIETLASRIVPRIRALVILPTRDLALQVKNTFDTFVKGTDLKIALVCGQHSFVAEQGQLVSLHHSSSSHSSSYSSSDISTVISSQAATEGNGASSKVDIVIATPGRLIDHLNNTHGFTLRHLRFLVVDEADRLLNQSYHNWLPNVLNAAEAPNNSSTTPDIAYTSDSSSNYLWSQLGFTVDSIGMPLHTAVTKRKMDDIFEGKDSSSVGDSAIPSSHINYFTPFQKLLFSATLTRNPGKISSLQLRSPTYIAVSSGVVDEVEGEDEVTAAAATRYVAPATLDENMILVDSAAKKPLILLHLLFNLELKGVLVFAKSVEAAHRLAALINEFKKKYNPARLWFEMSSSSSSESEDNDDDDKEGRPSKRRKPNTLSTSAAASAYSSTLSPSDRRRLLSLFQSGRLNCLICSDVMSRGIDLGSSVRNVVNYDVPTRVKAYIHRVGRTARAGRTGSAYSIIQDKELRWFKREISDKTGRLDGKDVTTIECSSEDLDQLTEAYKDALAQVGKMVRGDAAIDEDGVSEVVEKMEETVGAITTDASSVVKNIKIVFADTDSDDGSSDVSGRSSSSSSSEENDSESSRDEVQQADTTLKVDDGDSASFLASPFEVNAGAIIAKRSLVERFEAEIMKVLAN